MNYSIIYSSYKVNFIKIHFYRQPILMLVYEHFTINKILYTGCPKKPGTHINNYVCIKNEIRV